MSTACKLQGIILFLNLLFIITDTLLLTFQLVKSGIIRQVTCDDATEDGSSSNRVIYQMILFETCLFC